MSLIFHYLLLIRFISSKYIRQKQGLLLKKYHRNLGFGQINHDSHPGGVSISGNWFKERFLQRGVGWVVIL